MSAVEAFLKGLFENVKVYLIAGAICVVIAVGAGIGYEAAHAKAAALQAALTTSQANEQALQAQVEANAAAAKVAAKQRARTAAQAKERNAKLQSALAASSTWADQSVPSAVADSLRHASDAGAVGSPASGVLPSADQGK